MTKRTERTRTGWNFDNSYARLPQAFFTKLKPHPVAAPELVLFNTPLAEELGLDGEMLQTEEGTAIFAGNEIPEGAAPLAQAYAGHQFGNLTMLGDGRAVLLGEQLTPNGRRFDIQLKGAGRTPYSRGGDGRAALGPMLREYIISESMHALGIPTTRSLAVVSTGEEIRRETRLPGAILTRIAASHLRFGTFQYAASRGNLEEFKQLADYAVERHYPHIESGKDRYLTFFKEVAERHAKLVSKWQLVGFIHGVMNTDNMTISGETIDYGPCAFMNEYDPATVFSSIDQQARYAFGNQPQITGWNLARFAETLVPFLHEDKEKAIELAQGVLKDFIESYYAHWLNGMRAKLGMFGEEAEDEALIGELLSWMHENGADYTNTFRSLTLGQTSGEGLFGAPKFKAWHAKWQARLSCQEEGTDASEALMRRSNPSIIPRNHRVEEALDAAVQNGDYSVLEKLLDVLADPYAYSEEQEEYTKLPPEDDAPYQTFCGT
ncbi:YdiU family protein [Planococcus sp. 107-1]|uniref:protein adenylyltransferase SelO n=1 Tax=Planococcus sp. 107-1 TaxID=2908840 RepID=UPI001F3F2B0B|nr:YdiU family protein [Planococcus sp. 107-1]UJF27519.1 YdiU family protein [Planococcus sp. 107-1]